MIFVAIAGPSGSGKSTISKVFKEIGYRVYELDKIAKEFYPVAAPQIKEVFGETTINSDGTVNPHELGKIVFEDPAQMRKLNEIMVPILETRFLDPVFIESLETSQPDSDKIVVFDVPVIFDTHWHYAMDYILFVDASREVRLRRLIEGRNINSQIASKQVDAFNYANVRLRPQDIRIDNSNDNDYKDVSKKIRIWIEQIKKPEYVGESNARYTGWPNVAL